MLKYIFLAFLLNSSIAFERRLFMNYNKDINNIIRNKYYYSELPYNKLIQNIESHKIKQIYFTEKMDSVISEDVEKHDNPMEDYRVTKIAPAISNNLVDLSVKNEINTVFLQTPPPNVYQQIATNFLYGSEMFLFPAILLAFIISALRMNSQMNNPSTSLFGNVQRDVNKDKLQMQKANISLSSFAGSPEIFQECVEN